MEPISSNKILDHAEIIGIPLAVGLAVYGCAKALYYYRIVRAITFISKNNPLHLPTELMAAGGTTLVVSQIPLISTAFKALLLTKIGLDLQEKYGELQEVYEDFKIVLTGRFSPLDPLLEKELIGSTFFSISFKTKFRLKVSRNLEWLCEMIQQLCHLLFKTFETAGYLCDAYLILNDDLFAKVEGTTELFRKGKAYRESFSNNVEGIYGELVKDGGAVDKFLAIANPKGSFKAKDLREKIEPHLKKAFDSIEKPSLAVIEGFKRFAGADGCARPMGFRVPTRRFSLLPKTKSPYPPYGGSNKEYQEWEELLESAERERLNREKERARFSNFSSFLPPIKIDEKASTAINLAEKLAGEINITSQHYFEDVTSILKEDLESTKEAFKNGSKAVFGFFRAISIF